LPNCAKEGDRSTPLRHGRKTARRRIRLGPDRSVWERFDVALTFPCPARASSSSPSAWGGSISQELLGLAVSPLEFHERERTAQATVSFSAGANLFKS